MRQRFGGHEARSAAMSAGLKIGVSAGGVADLATTASTLELFMPIGVELIRVGASDDGGYLLPADLEGIAACFSPGVAEQASFEESMLNYGIRSYMIDGSVSESPVKNDLLDFESLFLDVVDGPGCVCLDSWVERKCPGNDDLVMQMDIEGHEWTTLLAASRDVLKRFRVIVLELHEMGQVFDEWGVKVIRATMLRLLEDFAVVHLHPNNYASEVSRGGFRVPRALELTLLRRDRLSAIAPAKVRLPHPLDTPNAPHRPDLDLRNFFGGRDSLARA